MDVLFFLLLLSETEKNILNKYIHPKIIKCKNHQMWFFHLGDGRVPPSVHM